jgi:hypothetical protein
MYKNTEVLLVVNKKIGLEVNDEKTEHMVMYREHIFFPVALRPNAGHGLLILQVSRSHNDAPQSEGLL